jgi:hypothetical protein
LNLKASFREADSRKLVQCSRYEAIKIQKVEMKKTRGGTNSSQYLCRDQRRRKKPSVSLRDWEYDDTMDRNRIGRRGGWCETVSTVTER